MTRCKHCLTKAEPLNGRCPVCGIEQEKNRRELSPTEKKVRSRARGIRAVAMFHLIVVVLLALVMPAFAPLPVVSIVALINAFLAFGLVRYSLVAYKAATIFYFFIGMVGVISIQKGMIYLAWIAGALVALYLVGNGVSKSIFERRLPES